MPVRPLTELAAGSRVLVDSNIFIYAADRKSDECVEFLERCGREELHGITTLEILTEVCHRLMLEDAFANGMVQRATAAQLRRKRQFIPQLRTYWPAVIRPLDMNLLLLQLDETRFRDAQVIRERYGLLTNDSLILAAVDSYGITNLATRDSDFDEVPWLTVYKPGDIT